MRVEFARLFEQTDLLLTPIASIPPERFDEAGDDFRDGVLPFTVPQDMAGLPSCAVPVGFDALGLPSACRSPGRRGASAACWPRPTRCSASRRGR